MIINGRYHLIRALQGSSPHRTFLADDTQEPDNGPLAVKQITLPRIDPVIDQQLRQLFFQRADALQAIAQNDTRLPQILDYFEEGGRLYLVREWIEGATLTVRVQKGGSLRSSEAERLLTKALDPLSSLHNAGIAHGNLKPSNLILARDGTLVIADFNLLPINLESLSTVPSSASAATLTEPLAASALCANDVYSLGLIGVYLLTGQVPQQLPKDPQTGQLLWQQSLVNGDPGLVEVLAIATHPDSSDRYATATEMLEDLQDVAPAAVVKNHRPQRPRINLARWWPVIQRGMMMGAIAALLFLVYSGIRRMVRPSATPTQQAASPSASASASPSVPASPAPATTPQALTQEQAIALVNRWLTAKQRIFSPPYDRASAAALTTNPLLNDITKPGGSVDWLAQNNARYEFRVSQIQTVQQFNPTATQASLDVAVTEDRALYVGDRLDRSQSGSGTSRVRYELRWVDGQWKIADYQDLP